MSPKNTICLWFDKDALDALVSCYKRTISESQWRKYVQFYAPDGSLRL